MNSAVIYSGILFILLLAGVFLFLSKKQINARFENRFLWSVNIFFLSFYFIYAVTKSLGFDEIEHIQSAWLIFTGEIPYYDFFQHHHPLLWYLTFPIFYFSGTGIETIIIFRILNYLVFTGILYLVYKITFTLTQSKKTALYSFTLLLAVNIFSRNALEIRPDISMTFFILLSYYYFIKFWQKPSNKSLILSGLFLSVSFLFLQKAVFFILPFLIVLFYFLISRKIKLKQFLIFASAALLPLLLFLFAFFASGYIKEYVVYNWIYNLEKPTRNSIGNYFDSPINGIVSLNFIFILIISIYSFIREFKNTKLLMKATFLIGVFQLLIISNLSTFYIHYYIIAIPFIVIPAGLFIRIIIKKYNLPAKFHLLFMLLIFGFTIPAGVKKVNDFNLYSQFVINKYINNTVKADEVVLTVFPSILFEKNAHFMFFQTRIEKSGNFVLQEIVADKKYINLITPKMKSDANYNPAKIIRNKKPVFIMAIPSYIQFYNLSSILSEKYTKSNVEFLYELKR